MLHLAKIHIAKRSRHANLQVRSALRGLRSLRLELGGIEDLVALKEGRVYVHVTVRIVHSESDCRRSKRHLIYRFLLFQSHCLVELQVLLYQNLYHNL